MKLSVVILASALMSFNSVAADLEVIPGQSEDFDAPARAAVKTNPPTVGLANADKDLSARKLLIESMVAVSILDKGYARGTLFSDKFVISGDEPRNLDAMVRGNVSWNGILTIAPVNFESYSRISINAYLYDLTADKVVGTVGVLREQCDGKPSLLESCIRQFSGNKDIAFSASVVIGHQYEIRLSAQCTTGSGPAGQNILCSFHDSSIEDIDGYVKWNGFTVSVEPDLVGLIQGLEEDHENIGVALRMLHTGHEYLAFVQEELKAGQEELKSGQEELKAGQEELKAAQAELKSNQEQIIQLLNTPEGQRPGWNDKDK